MATSPPQNNTNKTYQSPSQNESSPTPFTKKQIQAIPIAVTPPSNNKEKSGSGKDSALDLLDSAFEQVGGAEKSKIEENA